jgi:hypothetical protein
MKGLDMLYFSFDVSVRLPPELYIDPSPMKGLALRLQNAVEKGVKEDLCPGLAKLSAEDKKRLTELASKYE